MLYAKNVAHVFVDVGLDVVLTFSPQLLINWDWVHSQHIHTHTHTQHSKLSVHTPDLTPAQSFTVHKHTLTHISNTVFDLLLHKDTHIYTHTLSPRTLSTLTHLGFSITSPTQLYYTH